jgi:hypothetical protein
MNCPGGEADFSLPSFKPYVQDLDEEYKGHVESMMTEAFSTLSKSEKLMIRPLIEIHDLKQQHKNLLESAPKGKKPEHTQAVTALEKQIKAKLDVLNENGDIHVLIKKFNLVLCDLFKKKSSKSLAKMGADALLRCIEGLKSSGELK